VAAPLGNATGAIDKPGPVLLHRVVEIPRTDSDRLHDWAVELGCSDDELRSAMGEAGRVHFELSPGEQFELDLPAPA
jgi:hypothetical protein